MKSASLTQSHTKSVGHFSLLWVHFLCANKNIGSKLCAGEHASATVKTELTLLCPVFLDSLLHWYCLPPPHCLLCILLLASSFPTFKRVLTPSFINVHHTPLQWSSKWKQIALQISVPRFLHLYGLRKSPWSRCLIDFCSHLSFHRHPSPTWKEKKKGRHSSHVSRLSR